ncbi:unnamed protein product [Gongylonema pulchrum]|uniref:Uncharacterized protein n=1 Tax=Gongylonema pulchrum TaxID=637853 RepID=A0A183E8G6_9BILA|nr:unnamed protein product [Gongylonema pulchrum]
MLQFGGAFGGFVDSFLNRLSWWYRLPAFAISSLCLLSTVFALLGYRFDLFYGLIRIDFSKQEVTRVAVEKRNDNECYKYKKSQSDKFIECRREEGPRAAVLVRELYQKAFCPAQTASRS